HLRAAGPRLQPGTWHPYRSRRTGDVPITGRPKTDHVDRGFPHRPVPTVSRVHAVGPPVRELDVLAPLEGLDRHLLHLAVLVNVDHRGRVQVRPVAHAELKDEVLVELLHVALVLALRLADDRAPAPGDAADAARDQPQELAVGLTLRLAQRADVPASLRGDDERVAADRPRLDRNAVELAVLVEDGDSAGRARSVRHLATSLGDDWNNSSMYHSCSRWQQWGILELRSISTPITGGPNGRQAPFGPAAPRGCRDGREGRRGTNRTDRQSPPGAHQGRGERRPDRDRASAPRRGRRLPPAPIGRT